MASGGDTTTLWAVIPVIIGGLIAAVTAFVTQSFSNRASLRIEDVRLKGVFAVEDYKNDPTREIKNASRLLEQQLTFAKETIAKLAQESRTGRHSIVWWRLRDLFGVTYDIHAPKATAMRLIELYEDRVDTAARGDEMLWNLWQIVELLAILFACDEEIARVAPVFVNYRSLAPDADSTQYLAADVFAKLLIGTKGIASRGAFDQRISNGNKELARALQPSRSVLTDFSPKRSPVFWRLLLCEALLCDAVVALRAAKPVDLGAWPSPESHAQLQWIDDDTAGECATELAAARRFVQDHVKPFPRLAVS